MRSIMLIVVLSGLVPGFAVAQRQPSACIGGGQHEANLLLSKPLTYPIGKRYVVTAKWDKQPVTAQDFETRITSDTYAELKKLAANNAISLSTLKNDKNYGWKGPDEVGQGYYGQVIVQPAAITSDPTYHQHGDSFIVNRFTPSSPVIVSENELKSLTDRYCIVQFVFRATYTPLMSTLAEEPGNPQRKGRLLSVVDPFAQGWRILAFDFAPLDKAFTTTKVPDVASGFSLTR